MSVASPRGTQSHTLGSPLPIAEAFMTTPHNQSVNQMPGSNVRSWLTSVRPGTSSSMARMLKSSHREGREDEDNEEKIARAPLVAQDAMYARRGSSLVIAEERVVQGRKMKRIRLGALIPFIMSAISFCLTSLLVISGTSPGYYENLNLISFNTTNLGTGIISFVPATATATTTNAARRRDVPTISPAVSAPAVTPTVTIITTPPSMITPAPVLAERQLLSMLSPGDLLSSMSKEASKIGAGFNSETAKIGSAINSEASKVGSGINSAIASMTSAGGISLPTSLSLGGSGSSGILSSFENLLSGGLESIFTSIFGGIISSITSNVDTALNQLVTKLIDELKQKIGVRDYYSLHVLHACSGSSATNMTSCPSYGDALQSLAGAGSSIPTSFSVLGTNITSPILTHLKGIAEVAGPKADVFQKILLSLMILSLVGSGLSILFSFLAIFLPNARFLVYANLSLITVGVISRVIDAAASTLINILVGQLLNYMGNTVGLYAETGTMYLVFTWIAFFTATISSAYWFMVWFVEFREKSYRRRIRTPYEIGNYSIRSLKMELRDDIKGPKARYGDEVNA